MNTTTKTKTPPNGAGNTNTEPAYRSNPEIEAKIDNWIAQHQKDWTYIKNLPRERLERSLVLNEVRQIERRQRVQEGVMKEINSDPARKQAYDLLMKDVPEEQREGMITKMEQQKWRAKRTQGQRQAQTQTQKEGVGV
jgi:hypothetical protein